MARTTRHGHPTIGVLAGWQFYWTETPLTYLQPIFRGACQGAHDLGCNLLLGCGIGSSATSDNPLRPAWPVSSIDSDFVPIGPWNTDGLIAINPLHSASRSRYLQELIAKGHPVAFIASGEHGPTIVADNRSGILEAMQHLVAHGHRAIAFIAGSPEDMDGDTGDRLRAYHDAVEMYGLSSDPRLMAWGRHLLVGGRTALQEIMGSGVSFTAVLASNDESALGAIEVLREAGKRIPQDVAIVGFDDRPESAVQEPPLSSVRIPLRQMGYRAVESLYNYLTGETGAIEPARIATRLVPRASCGCDQGIVVHGAATLGDERQGRTGARPQVRAHLAVAMAAPVVRDAQGLRAVEIEALCQRLIDAFYTSLEQGSAAQFHEVLDAVLAQAAASGDEVHAWQAALSILGDAVKGPPAASPDVARNLLDQARVTISTSVQRQLRRHMVDQRWTLNRLGVLTARLLAALDETQVYDVLARHLPLMGIHSAWMALSEPEGDDPVAWSTLRDITSLEKAPIRCASRGFPAEGLLPAGPPFSLALFPLSGPHSQLGFVAFDTEHLDFAGAITQQLATALNSAQLYREATEGRRLAEEANELKSRFLSTVSHELRTPLNLIVGLSGILLRESAEGNESVPESYRRDVEHIYANAQHLGEMIGDVLDLASGDAGQLRLANEFVDLGDTLRLVAETGRQLVREKGLRWRADLPNTGPWVWGDRTRLRQIVLNLVNNAVKFTAQGEVCLAIESTADSVTVSVRDTGLGIPPEEQAVIFEEFRRSERSRARGYGGLGLGLAICQRLVELHGGTIGVRSSGEDGTGSTFYFTLPTVQPPAGQAQSPAIPSLTQESVLVLTHRSGSGQRLHVHLAERGFDVRMAFVDESPDWLSQLVVTSPRAVVVDVSAAPHHGWSVLKAIKAHPKTQHLPVLFCSLSSNGGAVIEFDYLTKPIELDALTQALDQQWLVPEPDRETKAVLVVDDDPSTVEMHARIVHAHSAMHRILRAQNGIEALDVLHREHVDLVLLDLMMPELDGFGVLEAMRESEATREVPVIVVTGQVLTEADMARLNRGVATVLSKGLFSVEETLSHVDSALERARDLSTQAQRLVRQAMAYIHEHYAEAISRKDLARHVALSEDYLTFCFRKELGLTPVAYLNRYRVHQAKQLLADPNKSVTEIALEVGFSDSGYFSRVFRREVGASPEAYRQT